MKIYNKKGFISGLFWILIGGWNLFVAMQHGLESKRTLMIVLLFALGCVLILRSLSKRLSQKDEMASFDERAKLARLKARSLALSVIEWFCFVCLIGCFLAYRSFSSGMFAAMCLPFFLIFNVIGLVELICTSHEEEPAKES